MHAHLQPDELFKFFLTHVKDKPSMMVHIAGTHTENVIRIETYTNDRGERKTREIPETQTVTDFDFKFDLSSYIADSWSHLMASAKHSKPSGISGMRIRWNEGIEWDRDDENAPADVRMTRDTATGQWRRTLEEYTMSNNWFKE
jgi:hypothetical protein